jgi:succinate dehydrogenase / fumarate reductase cytochrome b subunit
MQRALLLHQTSVGKKAIVAVTGVVMFGFLVGHMAGNLQVFLGPEKINAYAAFLKASLPLLWGTRVLLLVSVAAHIYYSLALAAEAGNARPRAYAKRENNATNLAAISMKLSGPTVALFIVYHLLHLTLGYSPTGAHSETNVYANVIGSFQIPWLAAIYIVAQLLLGVHLFHGAWSFFQTLGLSHPRYDAFRRTFAVGLTVLIVGGNISIPAAIASGLIPGDAQVDAAAGEPIEANNLVVE